MRSPRTALALAGIAALALFSAGTLVAAQSGATTRPLVAGQEVNPLVTYVEIGTHQTLAAVPGVVIHLDTANDGSGGWTAQAPNCDLVGTSGLRINADGLSEVSVYLTGPGNRTVIAYTSTDGTEPLVTPCGLTVA